MSQDIEGVKTILITNINFRAKIISELGSVSFYINQYKHTKQDDYLAKAIQLFRAMSQGPDSPFNMNGIQNEVQFENRINLLMQTLQKAQYDDQNKYDLIIQKTEFKDPVGTGY